MIKNELLGFLNNAMTRDSEKALREIKGNHVDELNMFYGMTKEQREQYMKRIWFELESLAHCMNFVIDMSEDA